MLDPKKMLGRRHFLKLSAGLVGTLAAAACTPAQPTPAPTAAPAQPAVKPTAAPAAAVSAADPAPEPEPVSADLQQQLIDSWNRLKPDAWRPLKHLSPSRQRSIRALGGFRQVLDLLPEVMAGAKANRWWSGKAIAFEQLIGTGLPPKGHFHALAEEAPEPSSKTNPTSTHARRLAAAINSIPALAGPQHPDFFPPEPLTGDLRPRHGFPSKAERLAAREDARRFYAASGVQA